MSTSGADVVTSAAIARRVGVGRAAVANWRRRYPDFPGPVAGSPTAPLFSWDAVWQWLVATGKADRLAADGRTGTGTHRIGDADTRGARPDRDLSALTAQEVLARVIVSLLPRLIDADPADDDAEPPVVLDPACADATLLVAVAERYGDHVRLAGQVPDEAGARALGAALPGVDAQVGDGLADDRFARARGTARAVLCVPPAAARLWPADALAADPRWRFGLPGPADPELAWVQHCLAQLRPHGVAVVAVSPLTGTRPAGRHVRAALVRAGVLRDVIALPGALTPAGEGPRHLWVLQPGVRRAGGVRMTDLTQLPDVAEVPAEPAAWAALFAAGDSHLVRTVELSELLDDTVSLVPSRHLRQRADTSAAEVERCTHRLAGLYALLGSALPHLTAQGGGSPHREVTLGELERSQALRLLPRDAIPAAGDLIFRTLGRPPVVATGTSDDEPGVAQVVEIKPERLDPHFVALFVRADALAAPVANTHAALTRDDVRRCRVPVLPLAEQRRYGDAFRSLQQVEQLAQRLAGATAAVVAQTVHGLTTGALSPAVVTLRESIDRSTDEKEKATT